MSSPASCNYYLLIAIVVIRPRSRNRMSNQYPYLPLAIKSTVRLIKLEELKVEDRIACKIRYAEQSTAEYDALSYVWGDPVPKREIRMYNDNAHEWTSFRVHESLWQFLDNIWRRQIFDRWLWTDCICLNQRDDEEKREQIPRMADIYRNAARVIAWLGLSARQAEPLLPVRAFLQANRISRATYWMAGVGKETDLAAKSVFWAEYWERVWILQELVSAEEIVFFVGDLDMTFTDVRRILDFAHHATNPGRASGMQFHRGIMEPAHRGPHAPKVDLWTLLSHVTLYRLKSQKPHDQVYGLLGLVANLSDGTSPLEHIEIDYCKPPADAFFDAILESHESWTEFWNYGGVLSLLLDRPDNAKIWEPIFTFLARYTESDRTSQRHKELAKLVLSVSDALYFIASTSGSPPGTWFPYGAFHKLFPTSISTSYDGHIGHTAQSRVAILGLALSLAKHDEELSRMFEDWKVCRRPVVEARSPWRCAAHRLSVRSRPPFQHIDRPRPALEVVRS